ncbi:MAG: FAD-binding oxidoreductase [Pseudomonadales bacterium]|nr:FAD-binding oxidoreductase [Pseudomonadales bacterium]
MTEFRSTINEQTSIEFIDELPEKVDVVIVGGGVIGISTALHLASQNISTLVCEKGRVAGEQSSRNWGWVRQQGRDPGELPVVMESINLWEKYSKQIDQDIGFTRMGVAFIAKTEGEMAGLEQWLKHAEQYQLDTRLMNAQEASEVVGRAGGAAVGGIITPSDGQAEPFVAVPALARHLQKQSGLVREACAVRALDLEAGEVCGVITEHGRVKCQTVLVAAGAWSSTLLGNHDISIPQLLVRGTVVRTKPIESFSGAAAYGGIGARRRQDGGYTLASGMTEQFVGADSFRHLFKYLPAMRENYHNIAVRFGGDLVNRMFPKRHWAEDEQSPFERARILDPVPSPQALRMIRSQTDAHFPELAGVHFEQAWAGMIDVMPDIVPIMDEVPDISGLFVATGFSAHGFGIGPGAGRVMGDLILGNAPGHDLSRFRFSRFSDGSRMQPGPGL